MSRARTGKHHAVFPLGYSTSSKFFVAVFALATWSQTVRAFFFELPHSRFRTAWVARYYHRLVEQLRDGNFSFVPSVSPDASLQLFSVGTYTGQEGWREALTAWRESFPSPTMELIEFLSPSGRNDVLLSLRWGGQGATSGLDVEDLAFLAIRVEEGMTVWGALYRDKAEALEAVGLRE